MRIIGLAERALELLCQRSLNRKAFGKPLAELGELRCNCKLSDRSRNG